MKILKSRYVKRDNRFVWLTHELPLEEGDELIEIRPMLIADDGKVLCKGEDIVGKAVWLKDSSESDYTEIDEPEEPEEVELEDSESDESQ